MKTLHKISALSTEWPGNLQSAADVAPDLGLSADRLIGLADAGFAPHYRIDGGSPLFKKVEVKRWAAANLLQKIDGHSLPEPVRVVLPASRVTDVRNVPPSIREIVGLCDISAECLRCGIYFLCSNAELLYIGQSKNAIARVGSHAAQASVGIAREGKVKNFTRVYFLPWPADDLDRVEAALIRTLTPPLNGRSARGEWKTSSGNREIDAGVIGALGLSA